MRARRTHHTPRRVSGAMVIGVVLALVCGAAVGWAARTVFLPTEARAESSEYTLAAAVPGEVGSAVPISVRAEWDQVATLPGMATGVVTTADLVPGTVVTAGEQLYSVDMRPVVVGRGSIPAYGDLTRGARGASVVQLQEFLADLGFSDSPADGRFGAATEAAVREWQRSAGFPDDGTVRAADIVWVPELPATLRLAPEIVPGAHVTPGEAALVVLESLPTFTGVLTQAQAALGPVGATVTITSGSGDQVDASVVERRSDANDPSGLALVLDVNGDECGQVCADVPSDSVIHITGTLVTLEPVTGLTVPTAAIRTDAQGTTFVRDADGAAVPVEVVQSARGISVVTGLGEGLMVRVPGGTAP